MQILDESTGRFPSDEDEDIEHIIDRKAKWIFSQLNSSMVPLLSKRSVEGGHEISIKED
ncbi:hypothetical protein Ancab_028700, partial [Ancistrocladus abbreviatus]